MQCSMMSLSNSKSKEIGSINCYKNLAGFTPGHLKYLDSNVTLCLCLALLNLSLVSECRVALFTFNLFCLIASIFMTVHKTQPHYLKNAMLMRFYFMYTTGPLISFLEKGLYNKAFSSRRHLQQVVKFTSDSRASTTAYQAINHQQILVVSVLVLILAPDPAIRDAAFSQPTSERPIPCSQDRQHLCPPKVSMEEPFVAGLHEQGALSAPQKTPARSLPPDIMTGFREGLAVIRPYSLFLLLEPYLLTLSCRAFNQFLLLIIQKTPSDSHHHYPTPPRPHLPLTENPKDRMFPNKLKKAFLRNPKFRNRRHPLDRCPFPGNVGLSKISYQFNSSSPQKAIFWRKSCGTSSNRLPHQKRNHSEKLYIYITEQY
ncbi:hypothetical protein VP01_2519g1 [Puccinia sorghi]|uniref:Uncharacterized protein n=1 Tax=Puccinia sorghi TaxID=27349 RepID=A0A0L6V5J1_9BASI|nr:hypothetical protein VP01_2519g1 [Puccinia sorghi]